MPHIVLFRTDVSVSNIIRNHEACSAVCCRVQPWHVFRCLAFCVVLDVNKNCRCKERETSFGHKHGRCQSGMISSDRCHWCLSLEIFFDWPKHGPAVITIADIWQICRSPSVFFQIIVCLFKCFSIVFFVRTCQILLVLREKSSANMRGTVAVFCRMLYEQRNLKEKVNSPLLCGGLLPISYYALFQGS